MKHTTEGEASKALFAASNKGIVLKGTGTNHINKVGIAEIRQAMQARNVIASSAKDAKEDRRRLGIRLGEEEELSELRAVTLKHPLRTTEGDELYTDPTRVVVCVLHVQVRTAEKVLAILCVKCLELNGGSKTKAHDILQNLDAHVRTRAKMGDSWGRGWNDNSGKTQTIKGMQLKGFEVDKMFSLTAVLAGNIGTPLQMMMPATSPDYERRRLCIGAHISFNVLLRQQDECTALDLTIMGKLGMIYIPPSFHQLPHFFFGASSSMIFLSCVSFSPSVVVGRINVLHVLARNYRHTGMHKLYSFHRRRACYPTGTCMGEPVSILPGRS